MIIDLSVALAADLPCNWPGLPPFAATETMRLVDDDVYSRSLVMEEHCGTHADAPNHIANADGVAVGDASIDLLALDSFYGRARVADLRGVRGTRPGESPWITPDMVTATLPSPLQPGDALLVRTGWSDERYLPGAGGKHYVAAPLAGREPAWPALQPGTIAAVHDLGVRLIGVDTPSLGAAHDPLPPHRAALGRRVAVVENLTRLGDVPADAMFLFLPLKIASGSGAPGRAIALTREAEIA